METLCRVNPSSLHTTGQEETGNEGAGRDRESEGRKAGESSYFPLVSNPWDVISTVLCDYISSCKYSGLKEDLLPCRPQLQE